MVFGVEEFPEGVVHSVDADFHKHEEGPGFSFREISDNLEVLLGHLVQLVQQLVFVLCSKFHVKKVLAYLGLNLVFEV